MNAVSLDNINIVTQDIYERIKGKSSKKELSDAKKYARQYSDAHYDQLYQKDKDLEYADTLIAGEEEVGHIKSSKSEGEAKVDPQNGTVTINPKHAELEEFEAMQWLTGQTYPLNTIVKYKEKNYICLTENISSLSNSPDKSTQWREITAPNLYGETNGELQVSVEVSDSNRDVYIPTNFSFNKMPAPHISVYQAEQPDGDTVITLNCYDIREQLEYRKDLAEITPKGMVNKDWVELPPVNTIKVKDKYLTEYKAYTYEEQIYRIPEFTDKHTGYDSGQEFGQGAVFLKGVDLSQIKKCIYVNENNEVFGAVDDGAGGSDYKLIAENWESLSEQEKVDAFTEVLPDVDITEWNSIQEHNKTLRPIVLHDTSTPPTFKIGFDYMRDPLVFPPIVMGQYECLKSVECFTDEDKCMENDMGTLESNLDSCVYQLIFDGELFIKSGRNYEYWNKAPHSWGEKIVHYSSLSEIKRKKIMQVVICPWWRSRIHSPKCYIKNVKVTLGKPPVYKNMIVGKDYNYEYIGNNVLKVSFNNSGKYVINYSS